MRSTALRTHLSRPLQLPRASNNNWKHGRTFYFLNVVSASNDLKACFASVQRKCLFSLTVVLYVNKGRRGAL